MVSINKTISLALILWVNATVSEAQKFNELLERSTVSFNYGLAYDNFAKKAGGGPAVVFDFIDRDQLGQIFGFDVSYRINNKYEIGFGFAKQSHRREYNETLQTSFASIVFREKVFRDTKNFHSLLIRRTLIEQKLFLSAGLYNLRWRNERISIFANSDETVVNLYDAGVIKDFGVWIGLERYWNVRDFQIGLRSRIYHTQGYRFGNIESFEFTPVVKFRL